MSQKSISWPRKTHLLVPSVGRLADDLGDEPVLTEHPVQLGRIEELAPRTTDHDLRAGLGDEAIEARDGVAIDLLEPIARAPLVMPELTVLRIELAQPRLAVKHSIYVEEHHAHTSASTS